MQKNGRSRGFGFVTFDSLVPAELALADTHWLDGRLLDVKRAVPGERTQERASNKIFVGGLPQGTTTRDLKTYFSSYGALADAVVMVDRRTNRSRGFGFVRFSNTLQGSVASEAVLRDFALHRLSGKWIEVKRAAPASVLQELAAAESSGSVAASDSLEASSWSGDHDRRSQTVCSSGQRTRQGSPWDTAQDREDYGELFGSGALGVGPWCKEVGSANAATQPLDLWHGLPDTVESVLATSPEAVVSAFPAEQGNHTSADSAAGAADKHAVRVEVQEHSCFVNCFDETREPPEDEACGASTERLSGSAPSTPRAPAKTFQRTPCRRKASLKMESPMKITAENLWSYEPLSFNPLSGVAFSPYISLNAWNVIT
jgi:hypothetical protein